MQDSIPAEALDNDILGHHDDLAAEDELIDETKARGSGMPLLLIVPASAACDEYHRAIAALEETGLKVGKEYSGDSQTVYTARGGND